MQQDEIGLPDLSCFISQHGGSFWLMCSTNHISMIMYFESGTLAVREYFSQAQRGDKSPRSRFIMLLSGASFIHSLQDDTFRASGYIVNRRIRSLSGSCYFWFIYIDNRKRFLWPGFSTPTTSCCPSAIFFIFSSGLKEFLFVYWHDGYNNIRYFEIVNQDISWQININIL